MNSIEKRYQVFVSSTYTDLRDARQEIMQALLELDCIPAGMELFPAADDDQWTLIKKVIDDCDYYILVVGGRYGSIGPGGKSYTQMEYEYAIEAGKPVIAFLHKEPHTLPAQYTEQTEQGRERLKQFRELAEKKMCRFWSTPADLGSAVSRSIVKLMKTNPGTGWVRADVLPSQSATEEILKLRRQIEDLQGRLGEQQSTVVKDRDALMQGDDPFSIPFTFGAYKSGWKPDQVYRHEDDTTWNGVFAALSPHLIDEASDRSLEEALQELVLADCLSELQRVEKLKDFELKNFTINSGVLETVKVQLLALGLIQKSTSRKARSVSDKSAYFTLTPQGEVLMMSLRALRRQPVAPAHSTDPNLKPDVVGEIDQEEASALS